MPAREETVTAGERQGVRETDLGAIRRSSPEVGELERALHKAERQRWLRWAGRTRVARAWLANFVSNSPGRVIT